MFFFPPFSRVSCEFVREHKKAYTRKEKLTTPPSTSLPVRKTKDKKESKEKGSSPTADHSIICTCFCGIHVKGVGDGWAPEGLKDENALL